MTDVEALIAGRPFVPLAEVRDAYFAGKTMRTVNEMARRGAFPIRTHQWTTGSGHGAQRQVSAEDLRAFVAAVLQTV